jgi:hypothetical protein
MNEISSEGKGGEKKRRGEGRQRDEPIETRRERGETIWRRTSAKVERSSARV